MSLLISLTGPKLLKQILWSLLCGVVNFEGPKFLWSDCMVSGSKHSPDVPVLQPLIAIYHFFKKNFHWFCGFPYMERLLYENFRSISIKLEKQVGAELCQAQAHVGLPPEAELILSFMEVPSIFSKLF